MSKSLKEKHVEMMNDPEYAREFALQEDEFQIARVLLRARLRAGMTQKDVAACMGTTQSVVTRMESGRPLPSLSSIGEERTKACHCETCEAGRSNLPARVNLVR